MPCPHSLILAVPPDVYLVPLMKWRRVAELHINLLRYAPFTHTFLQTLKVSSFRNLHTLYISSPYIKPRQSELDLSVIETPSLQMLHFSECVHSEWSGSKFLNLRLPPSILHLVLVRCEVGTLHLEGVNLHSWRTSDCQVKSICGFHTQHELEQLDLSLVVTQEHPGTIEPDSEHGNNNPFSHLVALKHVKLNSQPRTMAQFVQQAANMPHLENVVYNEDAAKPPPPRQNLYGYRAPAQPVPDDDDKHAFFGWLHNLRAPCRLTLALQSVALHDMEMLAQHAKGKYVF